MEIDGHGAVVTGGASGIGEAIARHLADLGADVTILDIDGARAADIAAQINGYSLHCDVREEQAVAAGITSAMARFGQAPRIVVNCAGIGIAARILGPEGKVSTPIFRHILDVNLMGAYHVMTYAAQGMMDLPPLDTGERGVIIHTVATGLWDGQVGQAGNATSAGGVAAISLPAAREFAAMGVRVMTIAPGPCETPTREELSVTAMDGTEGRAMSVASSPPRSGAPEEFARVAESIVRTPNLNGTVIRLGVAIDRT